ncbi:MAG: RluA family pseudouridine synthase [gamma proteobacterium symbiont of Bathyaustriella thionipta]|nr:RluA family pseudouridine synthase [gamma proteobacterium symbiont of Bathyaustriella thionipta]
MESKFEQNIPIETDAETAVDILSVRTGLGRGQIKRIMQKGAVWRTHGQHTRRLRRSSKKLQSGDSLYLYYDEDVLQQQPQPAELISDEGDYSVWLKPFGMLSQGSKWGDHCTLGRWVEQHLEPQRSAYLVHRLDRAASGLMLMAHSKRAAQALSELFKQRAIEKSYRVLVKGEYPPQPDKQVVDLPLDEKTARSIVSRLNYDAQTDRSLLHVNIETGRKHQIRRHLQQTGFPVVGDRLYGQADDELNLQLCANSLVFNCPLTHWKRRYHLPEDKLPALLRI